MSKFSTLHIKLLHIVHDYELLFIYGKWLININFSKGNH